MNLETGQKSLMYLIQFNLIVKTAILKNSIIKNIKIWIFFFKKTLPHEKKV